WLCIELLVVSVVLWYIVDCFYVMYTVRSAPLGFDIEHCYRINLGSIEEYSPECIIPYSEEQLKADKSEMIERMRRRPEVEAASYSINAHPYQGSNSGGDFAIDTLKTSGYSILRYIQPDFLRVFRIEGVDGETPEEMAEKLMVHGSLVSENLFDMDFGIKDMRPYVGKPMYMLGDTVNSTPVGGVYKTMRYNDYMQGQMNRGVFVNMPDPMLSWASEFVVRVRGNMDKNFIDNLMADASGQFRIGNLYIARVQSFDDIRDNVLLGQKRMESQYLIGMSFLLINIFLGLLGTFWFRTQQRVPDLAVRMVNGARRSDIYRLLVGEGLLMLTIVTPLALAIDANIAHMELTPYLEGEHPYLSAGRLLLCGGITYALMSLMIVAGISIPARRAMHIAPAEALRDE
ncbi:MAG: ABC transporter permease, partial [Muribaculaceae bacterium]|nr:ABC transporter permease [Muribaculaceae bacterium]